MMIADDLRIGRTQISMTMLLYRWTFWISKCFCFFSMVCGSANQPSQRLISNCCCEQSFYEFISTHRVIVLVSVGKIGAFFTRCCRFYSLVLPSSCSGYISIQTSKRLLFCCCCTGSICSNSTPLVSESVRNQSIQLRQGETYYSCALWNWSYESLFEMMTTCDISWNEQRELSLSLSVSLFSCVFEL